MLEHTKINPISNLIPTLQQPNLSDLLRPSTFGQEKKQTTVMQTSEASAFQSRAGMALLTPVAIVIFRLFVSGISNIGE